MSSHDEFWERSKSPAFTPVRRVKPEDSPGTPVEKAPDPGLAEDIIDQRRYFDRDFMRLEWERLWTKVWLLGGRGARYPAARRLHRH